MTSVEFRGGNKTTSKPLKKLQVKRHPSLGEYRKTSPRSKKLSWMLLRPLCHVGFSGLNEAFITLLPARMRNLCLTTRYHPSNLIHLLAKLFATALSLRLAPRLGGIVFMNQCAFIAGHSIHDNFLLVQQTARLIHKLPASYKRSLT